MISKMHTTRIRNNKKKSENYFYPCDKDWKAGKKESFVLENYYFYLFFSNHFLYFDIFFFDNRTLCSIWYLGLKRNSFLFYYCLKPIYIRY